MKVRDRNVIPRQKKVPVSDILTMVKRGPLSHPRIVLVKQSQAQQHTCETGMMLTSLTVNAYWERARWIYHVLHGKNHTTIKHLCKNLQVLHQFSVRSIITEAQRNGEKKQVISRLDRDQNSVLELYMLKVQGSTPSTTGKYTGKRYYGELLPVNAGNSGLDGPTIGPSSFL